MILYDLKIGDVILSPDLKTVELIITDLSDDFMIQNEISCLIGNNSCHVFRKVDE